MLEIVKNGGIIYGKINIGVVASVKKKKTMGNLGRNHVCGTKCYVRIYTYAYIV